MEDIRNSNKIVYLHQYILENDYFYIEHGKVIDHINGNKLDNRKVNLRIVTYGINNFNKNSKGYYYNTSQNKYIASIKVNGIRINLGRYDFEDDAILARKNAEYRYYPNIKLEIEAI